MEAIWKSKILTNKSKDMDSDLQEIFSSSKAKRTIERGGGVTHWRRPQFVMTREIYSTCST